MPKNAKYVTFGKSPLREDSVWFVPIGTEISPDPFTIPSANAIGLGFVSDEGDTETPGYGEPEAHFDANGTPVIHSDGDYEPSISASLLQSGNDFDVDKVVYGEEYVVGTPENYQINKCANNKSVGAIVIDHVFENKARERCIYPNATLKLSDDIQNTYSELRMLPVTITPAVDPETGFIGTTYKKDFAEG